MDLKDLKPQDASTKLEELNGVAEADRTEEQKTDIEQLTTFVTETTELTELRGNSDQLEDDKATRLVELSEKYEGVDFGKVDDKKKEEPPKPDDGKPAGTEPKKFAGIYESVEDLINGINSSEEERKRITGELSAEDKQALEDYYKGSQRVVTKAVDLSKKTVVKTKDIAQIPLEDRSLNQMTDVEYVEWQKKEPIKAQAWVVRATNLSSAQALSRQKVFAKYPNWLAMDQRFIVPSKEFLEFDRLDRESPDKYINLPNGPELCMTDMEGSLKIGKPAKEPVKPPAKKPVKSMAQGAAGKGASPASGKSTMSAEDFEALTPEEQEAHNEGSVMDRK